MIGLTLPARPIATENDINFPLYKSVDNQAAIMSGENFYSNPRSHLVTKFQRMMRQIKHINSDFSIMLGWVPGHEASSWEQGGAQSRENSGRGSTT
jgi:hypothetical protein